MDRLDEPAVKSILSAGRHMGRDRYQEGRIVLVGKHIKKWRGHFYVLRSGDTATFLSASNRRWTEARPRPSCARSSHARQRMLLLRR